jgi:uncharacterized RmlC-like cupin family protein
MSDRSEPFLLGAGDTRVAGAILPFKLLASDSGGLISVCEFTLPGWASGPVLHLHEDVDEGHFVVSGRLEVQLGDERLTATTGDFAWVPRGTAHAFACASPEPVHVLSFATPGGIEHLFAEQWQYLSELTEPPDPAVLAEIGRRHKAPTLGPPIRAANAPA